jgi:hypothetical protein
MTDLLGRNALAFDAYNIVFASLSDAPPAGAFVVATSASKVDFTINERKA